MPINTKTLDEFIRQISGKFSKVLPEVDPGIYESFVRALVESAAASGYSLQEAIKDLSNQINLTTADDDFVRAIAAYDKVYQFEAQPSTGFVAATGVFGTLIPISTSFISAGVTYQSISNATVTNYTGTVSLSQLAGIVTAVTSAKHTLATGLSISISGAVQSGYNGTFVITVTDENTFTYEPTVTGLTTDSGSYGVDYALVEVTSTTTGQNTDLASGATLTVFVVDIDTTAYVTVNGLSGGADEESFEDFKSRAFDAHIITPGIATEPAIEFSARKIEGNTRIYIVRPAVDQNLTVITGGTINTAGYRPELGQSVVYVLRDNDVPITPSVLLLAETKQQIIDDKLWPNFLPDEQLMVLAPILVPVNFELTNIVPNTSAMQNAITSQLVSFFQDYAQVATGDSFTIKLSDLTEFLKRVQDATGAFLSSFDLIAPSSDITVNNGEISVRGTVVFS